jgi:hypothetical protein
LIHPGWVKTDMGGAGAEITPAASAAGIVKVVDELTLDTTGRSWKWNGRLHDWSCAGSKRSARSQVGVAQTQWRQSAARAIAALLRDLGPVLFLLRQNNAVMKEVVSFGQNRRGDKTNNRKRSNQNDVEAGIEHHRSRFH